MKREQIFRHNYNNVEDLVEDIFNRQYYTNHGPLDIRLEKELELFYENDSFLTMANFDIGLLISLLALNLDRNKKILIPTIIDKCVINCLKFMNLDYELEDVNLETGLIEFSKEKYEEISLILVNNSLGLIKSKSEVFEIAKNNNLPVLFISKYSFGIKEKNKISEGITYIEIFEFGQDSVLNGGNGAGIKTNNTSLAEKIRNIRSSYGAREKVKIPFTGNGRMSEIQAGLILLSFEKLKETLNRCYITNEKKTKLFENDKNFNVLNYEKFNVQSNLSLIIVKSNDLLINNKIVSNTFFKPINFGLISLSSRSNIFINNTFVIPNFD